ncbi:hydroxyacylglutathione hydrolase-like protein isoform X4 [Cebus imitator]|uniref:hydroxyacylglutathione hydrolase-like protein isoform X4 n=1 Tax=Cebus imitator TaxID=2715852 RepID=UPI00080A6880|nr:hydroxyacylglutathione hydrolase-like protein isoform X4 [Cebus imitator]
MKVKVIPVLEDNYMYLVIEELTREAVAVDVAVPKRLLEIVGREGVSLTAVLTTHHHWDHARGNPELARLRPGLAVLGADERIFSLTRRLAHGEELRVSARPREGGVGAPGPPALTGPPAPPPQFGAIHVRCLLTPGHTSGHMSYFLWEDDCPDPPALFSGTRRAERAHPASRRPRPLCSDPPSPARGRAVGGRLRLVLGGQRPADVPEPGRAGHPAPRDGERAWALPCFPVGTAPTLRTRTALGCGVNAHQRAERGGGGQAAARALPGFPAACALTRLFLQKVFCGHEHTLSNLEFAQKVEPCNVHVRAKLSWAKKRDEDDVPTVPSTLGEERLYNPFLRVA